MNPSTSLILAAFTFAASLAALPGCKPDDMADQARVKTLGKSAFYANTSSARPLIQGTVTTAGVLNHDEDLAWSHPIPENAGFPFKITPPDLQRGQQLFNIYCTPCHGLVGDGDGMVVRRGFSKPPSYHTDTLRAAAPGHFYNVITQGWGDMYSFNDKIVPADRWRVAAYIKALQLSQHAPAPEVKSAEGRPHE